MLNIYDLRLKMTQEWYNQSYCIESSTDNHNKVFPGLHHGFLFRTF